MSVIYIPDQAAAKRLCKCGGTMKIVGYIERHQSDVIEKILRHCGLWKEAPLRAPPYVAKVPDRPPPEIMVDYDFFSSLAN